ncbi:MAG: ABC transporter substrate-binding protein [Candidatus Sumerlaeota bacterium]|nr:ABC transporter substrate-binding protein [Candidatus Sumerlaeota bacterium]
MKRVFSFVFATLVLASAATYLASPDLGAGVPVLYWVTDPNPARDEQVALFQKWLEKNHYPRMELRLDVSNNNDSKKLIQGVSGVLGDIVDTGPMLYYEAVGFLEDMTDAARRLGFEASKTYPALEPDLTVNGRLYRFPCNVTANVFWVNKETFRKYGVPLPPKTWDFETFERLGKEFVKAANPPGKRQKVFFTDRANVNKLDIMRRSLGLSVYNETMTRCILDDPRNVECLRLLRKWTDEDHILPSAADEASFSTDQGYGGIIAQLFYTGNYAMFQGGRYFLILFRQFGKMDLGVVHMPCQEFDNATIATRAAVVYRGSPHKDLAAYFLAFLASDEYNMHIIKDGDSLPPIPAFTRTEAYLHPPDYPNEWEAHKEFAEVAETISITRSNSPFVVDSTYSRIEQETLDAVLAGLYSPEGAAPLAARRLNEEIQLSIKENHDLRDLYEQLTARQQEIDRLRAAGKKVPAHWLDNPFHKTYYALKGCAEWPGPLRP